MRSEGRVAMHIVVAVHNEFSQCGQKERNNLSSSLEEVLLAHIVSEKCCVKKVKEGKIPELTNPVSYIATVAWPGGTSQHWCRKKSSL